MLSAALGRNCLASIANRSGNDLERVLGKDECSGQPRTRKAEVSQARPSKEARNACRREVNAAPLRRYRRGSAPQCPVPRHPLKD
jgi:hypothetical protein